tara:strand:+ start:1600 stop:1866 length:267 start_codon:yes stop_codon:yes gene_type:complete
MDLFASIFLVIALASTVGVKYGTTVRTIRLREKLIEAESTVRTARGKFKGAQKQKEALSHELKQAQHQKKTLDKKAKRFEEELTSLNR